MIDLPTNIRPRWGRNPRIHVWGASASARDARGSSRDTPGFTSEEFQLQPTARQEVPEIPQRSPTFNCTRRPITSECWAAHSISNPALVQISVSFSHRW
jgi:hypothetical protein